ncbi:MAG: hypothetical protein P4L40_22275 [Terracidiphilus sp.]|nr:hypothetical protein [Terracidiphilus sp.]
MCVPTPHPHHHQDITIADVVVMHTDVPVSSAQHLLRAVCRIKVGARFVTYHDLDKMWPCDAAPPFDQLAINGPESVCVCVCVSHVACRARVCVCVCVCVCVSCGFAVEGVRGHCVLPLRDRTHS